MNLIEIVDTLVKKHPILGPLIITVIAIGIFTILLSALLFLRPDHVQKQDTAIIKFDDSEKVTLYQESVNVEPIIRAEERPVVFLKEEETESEPSEGILKKQEDILLSQLDTNSYYPYSKDIGTKEALKRRISESTGNVRLELLKKLEILNRKDRKALEDKKLLPKIIGKYAIFRGTVTSTLSLAASKTGLKFGHVKKLMAIFTKNINFNKIVKGDSFTVVFSKYNYNKNNSRILAAEFKHNNHKYQKIYYKTRTGKSAYYLLGGKGPTKLIVKTVKAKKSSFLRYALRYNRISSHFNPKRRHPITRRIRPHKGTDFAAPRGRRVWATADGVISFAGWQRGYGKVVKIRHKGGKYNTVYAHLSKIERGITRGVRVKQKTIIGRVGNTGGSTGNHLHYEFKIGKRAVNSLNVKLPVGTKKIKQIISDPKEKKNFMKQSKIMSRVLKLSRIN